MDGRSATDLLIVGTSSQDVHLHTVRFASTTKVLANRMLMYYMISYCCTSHKLAERSELHNHVAAEAVIQECSSVLPSPLRKSRLQCDNFVLLACRHCWRSGGRSWRGSRWPCPRRTPARCCTSAQGRMGMCRRMHSSLHTGEWPGSTTQTRTPRGGTSSWRCKRRMSGCRPAAGLARARSHGGCSCC